MRSHGLLAIVSRNGYVAHTMCLMTTAVSATYAFHASEVQFGGPLLRPNKKKQKNPPPKSSL